jgi:hypothetical protein
MFKLVLSISPYPPQTHAVQFVTHPSQPNAEPRHWLHTFPAETPLEQFSEIAEEVFVEYWE